MVSLDSSNINVAGFRRKYTCIPDVRIDDLNTYAAYHTYRLNTKLPSKFEIDTSTWVVHDQEEEKSCVGYAVSTAREHYINSQSGSSIALSPLFIYWWARKMDNIVFQDGGSRISNAMVCLSRYGVCEEMYHKSVPGTSSDVFLEPNTAAMAAARKYTIKSFHRVPSLDMLRDTLATGAPIVAGIPVYESLEKPEVTRTGIIPIPEAKERILGGHAIVLIGYDDAKELIKFHNSWGLGWGDKGCGYIPYQFLRINYFDAWEMIC